MSCEDCGRQHQVAFEKNNRIRLLCFACAEKRRGAPANPDSVLTEAEAIVHGARRQQYGTPMENHTRTAEMWSAYLGVPISAQDVCMLNVLQKVSRARCSVTRDTLVDIAGYAENARQCVKSPTSETPAAGAAQPNKAT